tara:strand:+ start:11632 stop:12507 length:876 start_codon:yes stop_codon:yes gene_type:complete
MDKIDKKEEYLPEMSMPEPPPEPVNDNLFSDEEPDEPQMPTMVVKPRVDTDTIFKKKKKVVAVVEEEKIIEPVEPVEDEELYDDEGGMTFNADDSSDEESGGANFIYSSGEDEPVEPVVVVPKKRGRPKKPPPVYPEGTVLSKVTGKPKKVMSEKTKEALRLGRLKSLETRRAKKEKKESIGVIRDEVYPRDEVVETEGKKTQKPRPKSRRDGSGAPQRDNGVSKKELQNMMLNTIMGYEAQKTKMDKEAKIIRDKEEVETAKRNELNKTIQRALNPNDMDFYGDCFKFTQ